LELLEDEIEVDENHFGDRRKGNRVQGEAGKVPVFSLLKCNGKVFTAMITDAKTDTLLSIIKQQVRPDSIVCTDTWRS